MYLRSVIKVAVPVVAFWLYGGAVQAQESAGASAEMDAGQTQAADSGFVYRALQNIDAFITRQTGQDKSRAPGLVDENSQNTSGYGMGYEQRMNQSRVRLVDETSGGNVTGSNAPQDGVGAAGSGAGGSGAGAGAGGAGAGGSGAGAGAGR